MGIKRNSIAAVTAAIALGGMFTPVTARADDSTHVKVEVRNADSGPHSNLFLKGEKVQAWKAKHALSNRALPMTLPDSYYLPNNHQGQLYSNYCGPATMSMALSHLGVSWSQSYIAPKVGISPHNGGTGVDAFLRVVNSAPGAWAYDWASVSNPATSNDKAVFKSRMMNDLNGNTGTHTKYPIIGDVWELAGNLHLPGHPVNQTIYHWVEVRGYKQAGAYVQVQDPAYTVWSTVSDNYPFPTDQFVVLLGGRGYLY